MTGMKANDAALKVYGYKRTNRMKAYAVKKYQVLKQKNPRFCRGFFCLTRAVLRGEHPEKITI